MVMSVSDGFFVLEYASKRCLFICIDKWIDVVLTRHAGLMRSKLVTKPGRKRREFHV